MLSSRTQVPVVTIKLPKQPEPHLLTNGETTQKEGTQVKQGSLVGGVGVGS